MEEIGKVAVKVVRLRSGYRSVTTWLSVGMAGGRRRDNGSQMTHLGTISIMMDLVYRISAAWRNARMWRKGLLQMKDIIESFNRIQ